MKICIQITSLLSAALLFAAVVILCSFVGCEQPSYSQSFRPAPVAALVITNARPGEIIDLVTIVMMPGVTNVFTNALRLPLVLTNLASNTVAIYRTYFGSPQNNFLVAMNAPPPFPNFTNCALFASSQANGPWSWIGSFPNHGQPVAMMVTNNGGNQFFRAANIYTP